MPFSATFAAAIVVSLGQFGLPAVTGDAGFSVQTVKHGYFRRDLGLDPAYHAQQWPDADHEYHRPRGFRSDNAATEEPGGAGIYIWDDGNGGNWFMLPNGLRFDPDDPGQNDPR